VVSFSVREKQFLCERCLRDPKNNAEVRDLIDIDEDMLQKTSLIILNSLQSILKQITELIEYISCYTQRDDNFSFKGAAFTSTLL
jgi:hypothetical protein